MIDVIGHDSVRELRLNRPPVNALNPSLLSALAAAITTAPAEGAAAVVISAGPGVFSGGLDVPHLVGLEERDFAEALVSFFDLMAGLAASEIPVAAAITGHSPAGGAVVALFCDWRVMAEGEYGIGFNEVQIGIPMPTIVAGLIERTVGRRHAERLCVTGDLLNPGEALEMGLVDELASDTEVVERAIAWCRKVTTSPAQALSRTRATLRRDLVELVAKHREADAERLTDAWFQPELQAAMTELVRRLKGG